MICFRFVTQETFRLDYTHEAPKWLFVVISNVGFQYQIPSIKMNGIFTGDDKLI